MLLALLEKAKQKNIRFYLKNGKDLAFQAPAGAFDTEFKAQVVAKKAELIAFLQQSQGDRGPKPLPREPHMSLSLAQQRLWFIDAHDGGSAQYNIPTTLRLEGELDVEAMQTSLRTIVARHEILRTQYHTLDGQGWQQILPAEQAAAQFQVRQIALEPDGDIGSDIETGEGEQQLLNRLREEEAGKVFDLSRDLMLRGTLVQLQPQVQVLLLTLHHIACDGWSMGILVREFAALYQAHTQARSHLHIEASSQSAMAQEALRPVLPALPIQYVDFAAWQKQLLQGDKQQQYQDFWQQQLQGIPDIHSLPLDYPRPAQQDFSGATYQLLLESPLLEALQDYAHQQQCTLFMVLHSAFVLLLARWSGQNDIVVGTPVAGRSHKSLEDLIGFFINTVVLRTPLDMQQPFTDFLLRNKSRILSAFQYQDMPVETLMEEHVTSRSQSYTPLFQIMFGMQNLTESQLQLPGLRVESLAPAKTVAKFDLDVSATVSRQGLSISWLYAKALFTETYIANMSQSFACLLRHIVMAPDTPLHQLPLLVDPALSARDLSDDLLLGELTDTLFTPAVPTLPAAILEQAQQTPDALAVVDETQSLTYRSLVEQAAQLAQYLVAQGITPQQRVAVASHRRAQQLVQVLGIWMAGCIYVPLNSQSTSTRNLQILRDCQASMLLTYAELAPNYTDFQGPICCLDQLDNQHLSSQVPNIDMAPDAAAYIIYTSGTTGRPKGVVVGHDAICQHIQAMAPTLGIRVADKVMSFAGLHVDAALDLTFCALITGATVVVKPESVIQSTELYALLRRTQVNVLDLPPAYLTSLLAEGERARAFWQSGRVRMVVLGGEAMSPAIMQAWQRWQLFQHCQLCNAYGPTEAVVTSTLKCFSKPEPITIGQAVGPRDLQVLDPWMQPVPQGVIGELYIGGDCLAQGYWQQPEQSQQSFVRWRGQRYYKTGDRVRYNVAGELLYCGRNDDQIQIRGYRVEPEEIRLQLLKLDSIAEAIVLAKGQQQQLQLVAYYRLEAHLPQDMDAEGQSQQQAHLLRQALAQVLPDYMIPAHFVALPELAYTDNGKIDIKTLKGLPLPEGQQKTPPQSATQKQVCRIWQAQLGVPVEDIYTSFFALGGHSLIAVKVAGELSQHFALDVAIRDIFQYHRVFDLAELIDRRSQAQSEDLSAVKPIVAEPEVVSGPMSFSQQRLWFLHTLEGQSLQYNMPTALRLMGPLDVDALQQAFDQLLERHPILRTVYVTEDGVGVQRVMPAEPLEIRQVTLSANADTEAQIMALLDSDMLTGFDLAKDVMLRATLVKQAPEAHVLLVNTHHIASDGWSVGLMVRDFCALYGHISEQQPLTLPTSDIHYIDYARWQRQSLSDTVLQQKLAFWQDYLADAPALHSVPLDHRRPDTLDYQGALLKQSISEASLQGLKQLATAQNTTLFTLLQTAFAVLIARWSNSSDVVMGTPTAGRDNPQTQNVMGLFVNTLILRTQVDLSQSLPQLLNNQSEQLLSVFEHQDVPFEMLVDHLQLERSRNHMPLFQIMFSMQNLEGQSLSLPELQVAPLSANKHFAKFDLELSCGEVETGTKTELRLTWNYATALFSGNTIKRLSQSFAKLLTAIAQNPQQPLGQIDLLPPGDWQDQVKLNQTQHPLAQSASVPLWAAEQLQQQVAKRPDANALHFAERSMTWRQLQHHIYQLGHYLQTHGVNSSDIVGICCYRSLEMVLAIHSIWQVGAAYLPLDPELPQERLAFMATDSGLQLLLGHTDTQDQTQAIQQQVSGLQVLDISTHAELPWHNEPDTPIAMEISGDSAAYMIYTSGTTGQPKGVLVEHRALANRMQWMQSQYPLGNDDVVLQKTPYSFDVSVWEFAWPLMSGASLVVAQPEAHKDPLQLQALIQQHQVTTLHFVPSMLNIMLQSECLLSCSSIRRVFCSGEALPLAVIQGFHQQQKAQLHNLYGPTEAAIDVSYWQSHPEHTQVAVPIGKPVHNTGLWILDSQQQPVPFGVPGELYISGVQLAREYLNRPELTQSSFVELSLPHLDTQRFYKTGDLARLLPSGDIAYLGRIDHQIKLNGLRIELGEIESVIRQFAEVEDAAVLVQADASSGQQQLVAYLVPESLDLGILRSHLSQFLPAYMVPEHLLTLAALPLSANGKLDRKQLPALEAKDSDTYVPPITPLQRQICEIWQAQLGGTVNKASGDKLPAIGITDSFFKVGGDSIKAIAVVTQMKQAGLAVSVKDIFSANTVQALAQLITEEQGNSEEIELFAAFELLTEAEQQQLITLYGEGVFTDQLQDAYPLTYLQQGMIFQGEIHQGQGVYHDVFNARMAEALDIEVFSAALADLVQQHEVLRAQLLLQGERPLQLIQKQLPLPLTQLDWQHLSGEQQQQQVLDYVYQRRDTPLSLQDRYWHITLIQLAEDAFQFVMDFHHAMWDGWSIASFNNALFAGYQQRRGGKVVPVVAGNQPLPYRYYVGMEQQALLNQRAKVHWQEALQGTSLPWWSEQTLSHLNTKNIVIDGALAQQLSQLAKQLNIQEKSLFLGLHAVLMAQIAGQNDLVTSYVSNGRPEMAGGEHTLGLFLNTLPIRIQTHHKQWWLLLQTLEAHLVDSHEFRHFPVAEIQKITGLDFASSMFNYTNFHVYDSESLGSSAKVEQSFEQNNYLWATEVAKSGVGEQLSYQIKFSAEQQAFSAEMLARFANYFSAFARQLVSGEHPAIAPVFADDELEVLQKQLATSAAADFDLWQSIASQATAFGNKAAIRYNGEDLSYQHFVDAVVEVTAQLQQQGVQAGDVVAVALQRHPRYLQMMFALYRMGAVYLPLDLNHPEERLQHVLQDSQCRWIALESEHQLTLPSGCQRLVAQRATDTKLEPPIVASEATAYLMYTSGSTGKPKGVAVSRRALNHFLASAIARLQLSVDCQWLALTTTIFDISLLELIAPLCSGGTVHLLPSLSEKDGLAIAQYLDSHAINTLQATPSGWKLLLAAGWQGKPQLKGLTGGEALPESLAQALLPLCGQGLVNCYGPTEATIWSHMADIHAEQPIRLGEPLQGYGYGLVDSELQPVPMGVPGELVLAGPALAQGYWQQDELTQERFVELPSTEFSSSLTKVYRTGDKACFDPELGLRFLGRLDQQVKVKGHRIELGEIEAQLRLTSLVQDAVVLVQQQAEQSRLVAYVIAQSNLPVDLAIANHETTNPAFNQVLLAELERVLPNYMLPEAIAVVEHFPLTANGKLDRKALPALTLEVGQTQAVVAPRDPLEAQIFALWQQVLAAPEGSFGVNHGFFAVGGDSLSATRLLTLLNRDFSLNLSIRDIFTRQSIAELAQLITDTQALPSQRGLLSITAQEHAQDTPLPLSFAQQRLWFIDALEGESRQYNLPSVLQLTGELDIAALQWALTQIVSRHEILRTRYIEVAGQGQQIIGTSPSVILNQVTLTPEQATEAALVQRIQDEANTPFDLSRDLMLRCTLLTLPDAKACEDTQPTQVDYLLLFTMHHIASDGWSMGILIREFGHFYQQAVDQHHVAELPALPLQYADYALWQRQYLNGAALDQDMAYWRSQLADCPEVHALPLDYARPAEQAFTGALLQQKLDAQQLTQLQDLAKQQGVTLFMLLQSAFALLLGRWSYSRDIVMGTPVAGRDQAQLEPLIGFFVNSLVLRTELDWLQPFDAYLKGNSEQILTAFEHQHLPFERLVDELQPSRNLSYTPLFQIMFSLQNFAAAEVSLPKVQVSRYGEDHVSAKFDLELSIVTSDQGLAIDWTYASHLFAPQSIVALSTAFAVLLENIVAQPQLAISQLAISKQATQALPEYAQGEPLTLPANPHIAAAFADIAAQYGDKVAAIADANSLTYRELLQDSQRLAAYLQEQGVEAGSHVGLCCTRSLDMLRGMLAILQLDAVYVPLDIAYPRQRLAYMAEDTGMTHLIIQESLLSQWPVSALQTVVIDAADNAKSKGQLWCNYQPSSAYPEVSRGDHIACLLYTSGTTGNPKGVRVTHQGIFRLLGLTPELPLNADTIMGQFSSISFDAATYEIWGALLNGGTLVLNTQTQVDLEHINGLCQTHQINAAFFTSSLLDQWSQSCHQAPSLRWVISGGEVMSVRSVQQFYQGLPKAQLFNVYGPTECVAYTTLHPVAKDADPQQAISLGRPIAGTQLWVLDEQQQPLPKGAVGMLFIGGEAVAKGYLNQPQLSAKSFVRLPHLTGSKATNAVLYKTGDLVRFDPQGQLSFYGRKDAQVKIRGFRIELSEIELAYLQCPEVDKVKVLTRGSKGSQMLVAFIKLHQQLEATELTETETVLAQIQQQIQQVLPQFMIPSQVQPVPVFPLTANGKVDSRALLANYQIPDSETQRQPTTALEKQILSLWQQVLLADEPETPQADIPEWGIDVPFFSVGGNSINLLALKQGFEAINRPLSLKQLMENQSIAAQAQALEQTAEQAYSQMPQWDCIVRLNEQTQGTPLVIVHPFGGGVEGYRELAQQLAPYCPVYGIQAPFMYGLSMAVPSLEVLAAYYSRALSEFFQADELVLAGYSGGGQLAAIMAEQLPQLGQNSKQVAQVVLFDSNYEDPDRVEGESSFSRFGRFLYSKSLIDDSAELPQQWQTLDYPTQLRLFTEFVVKATEGRIPEAAAELALAFSHDLLACPMHAFAKPLRQIQCTYFLSTSNAQPEANRTLWGAVFPEALQVIDIDFPHGQFMEPEAVQAMLPTLLKQLTQEQVESHA